ncbi:DevR family CRISPR-associated autoregulator [Heliorestis convoluta]|uniref:CRISPR-associated negative auto-regulator DevR/Csa2 protein n=1 Tax=Heliorestis convoluta TaxID=356322 RepID=A0A5Q2N4X1_9FIRM|nr:DevR family CRISPR-associated autoregulator [Heliorestis convoluta]QGG48983.1 CRISPR-associated negative auto-regulator DevR/Csa2 protein [Heliorestis convoluta]
MKNDIKSFSLSAQVTLDMHCLNNEGTEGNYVKARMVHIVDQFGEIRETNAISGDMLKHIQTESLISIAKETGLPLCAGCNKGNANRINVDRPFLKSIEKIDSKNNIQILNEVIPYCTVDDLAGVLITEGRRSVARKSVVEFGWLLGIPERTTTESHLHVKFDTATANAENNGNRGPILFYRPSNSGVYALVMHVELNRVGYHDGVRQYVIDDEERKKRQIAMIRSIIHMLISINGAHKSTDHPHLLSINGVVTTSTNMTPAPTLSPLKDTYEQEIIAVAEQLNRWPGNKVHCNQFNNLAQLVAILTDLAESL